MASQKTSIEEQVEDWCKRQLHPVRYYTKTERINSEIEEALYKSPSKKGGEGTNYPDIKCLIETADLRRIPVMIEVKGSKGDFIKSDAEGEVENLKKDKTPNFTNIAKYAVNGAVHYAHAVLNYTESYKEAVAIGVNGYDTPAGRVYELGVYYVSKENLFVPKKVNDYTDLSFLLPEHLNAFVDAIDRLSLTEDEIERKKLDLEDDIERRLKEINQKMHGRQLNIEVGKRVQLITGLVMAGLGVPGKVSPLRVDDLRGEMGERSNDGQVVMNKISDYLTEKKLPAEKIEMIKNVLNVVFLHSKLQEPVEGVSRLHTLYKDVRQNIMPFLTGELHNIDFTGRLFNVLNEWVDVPDGDKNDVVLTPRYVTEFMAKLCEVNMDSYVWDFATGSAGFLISSMHQMIADAKARIQSPEELARKINHIKMEQLLGIEKLPDIYLLAVLNMILMQDGSSNIIHGDSLADFNGNYEQGELCGKPFPANVFLLNPPYSADGKGFVFVEKALRMMHHGGKAAVLIQENAGSGNGLPMSGYTDIELVENCSVYIPVKRAVAKLNLTISNATSSEIVVNKIIYGYGNNEQATGDPGFISDRCWLFESYNQDMPDGTQYASLIFGANENLGIRIPPSSDAMHVCYIYPCNSDVDSYRLGIETEGETYLPSRFDSNSGTPINHIARNTQVNIFASISSESTIKINFEVTPWTAKSVAVPDFD